MVHPSEIIEPQPKRIPPSSAVALFRTVGSAGLKRLPAKAAANEDATIPRINQPLLVMVSEMTAIQPAIRSRPTRVSSPILLSVIKVLAWVLIWRVTPSGSTRRYAIVPTTPTSNPVVIGLQRSVIERFSDAAIEICPE